MATKKAAKKTTKKAVKKAPAKKTATKRTYTRKPKAVEEQSVEFAAQGEPAPEVTFEMAESELSAARETAYDMGYDMGLSNGKSAYEQKAISLVKQQREKITNAEVIKLDGLPEFVRVAILLELADMGYLYYNSNSLLDGYIISDLVSNSYIKLNHTNKLVSVVNVQLAKECNKILTITGARSEIFLFGEIGDNKPSTLEVDGARYVRVG